MSELKIKLLVCLCIFNFIQIELAASVCEIPYSGDIEISPIYAKNLGKYTLQIPYNGKKFILNDGESIQAICRTNFSSISYTVERKGYDRYHYSQTFYDNIKLLNQTSIKLECHNAQLYYQNFILKETLLSCNKLKWSVFDTNETYEWCEKNPSTKTLLLAAKTSGDHHVLAGICFNLTDWSLQTITYNVTNAAQKHNKEMQRDITKTQLKSFQSLGEDVSNMENNHVDFTENDLQQQLTELRKSYAWLSLANYEISPMVQGDSYGNYFKEFVHILNMVWWRNLRLGNWKLFMNTLENYAHANSFQIYAGTDGAVKIPAKNTADILEVQNGYFNKTVPLYIWNYLISTDNQNEDLIVVGYNSPFAEWFDNNDVVFCPNICSQIPWLKEIYPSFRYATAGIMFCCSTDFILQTNYLHNFPMDVLIARVNNDTQSSLGEIENASGSSKNVSVVESTAPYLLEANDVEVGGKDLLEI